MNRKGFIRTLEAIISVIIVLGIILALAPSRSSQDTTTPTNVKEAQLFILNHIATNEQFRTCINSIPPAGIGEECRITCAALNTFVSGNVPKGYEYRCEICNSASTCSGQFPLEKSLYTDSRLIATNPAKVVRLVFWQK